jgi:uncharacterized membrane protein
MTPTRRTLITGYALTFAVFLALDACWLGLMGPRLYQPALGALMAPQVDWRAAALFYPIYIGGLLYFAVLPALRARRAGLALCNGALFGFVAYATYDLTNQATLRDWPWLITLVDLVWGATVSGTAAWAAVRITCRPSRQRHAR